MNIPADLHISIRPISGQSFCSMCRMGEYQALTRQGDTPEDALRAAVKAWPKWAEEHPPVPTGKKPAPLPAKSATTEDDDEDLLG